ncbi:MAG: DNA adenine methylase [Gemmatimonadetes bacterium]|nr:DNA adenine methylase [Gemmatimonadota bacterium]
MGSKRVMLKNGLGELLAAQAQSALRVVDLFCGAAYVSWFAATELRKSVLACDLQKYAAVLAGAVVKRTKPIEAQDLDKSWLSTADQARRKFKVWQEASQLDTAEYSTAIWHRYAQELCSSDSPDEEADPLLVWRCYGGHYFSPTQALSFDSMLRSLPKDSELRELCLASVIIAASNCAAAPGHTAQPFKATQTAAEYLRASWLLDPFHYARAALKKLCPLYATEPGKAVVADANQIAKKLNSNDVVFVDPPYSAVQYSRFYHVLETIAGGTCSTVEGVGRYPPIDERPNSNYSKKSISSQTMKNLLRILSNKGCKVVLTFPKGECSNGLSGEGIEEMAQQFFRVTRQSVETTFSTLGGNRTNRDARKVSDELMLALDPI